MKTLAATVIIGLITVSALAASDEREKWIVGTWTAENPQRPARTVIFHADRTWGVRGYVPLREEINGRRWHLSGDQLILAYPGDRGLDKHAYKILSFTHDRFVTDAFTYTRQTE